MEEATMAWQTLVSAEELAGGLADPRLRLFDCRYELARPEAGRAAWTRGHLPGALHVDLHHDLAGPTTQRSGRHPLPDPQEFAARLRQWGVNDDSLLVAYDDSTGMWAARLWWMAAKWLGHRNVAVLDGGMRRWQQLQLPIMTDPPPARAAGNFVGRIDDSSWVDIELTQSAALDAGQQVIDARAPERYRGEVEPIDPVAGHVPGAVNHPTATVAGPDGRLLPSAELRDAFAKTLGPVAPSAAIAMCGSGVTACHLLLAMEHAGLPGARLYVGSWSEWSRDPSRPVARGNEAAVANDPLRSKP
jgi:thiosulfate/3-mercaptopyruvate sulfurtransferase